jgi:hypothetical protein
MDCPAASPDPVTRWQLWFPGEQDHAAARLEIISMAY